MKSLRALFRFGPGPSSSHTIAPFHAARRFKERIPKQKGIHVVVTFYGSLALTGIGHGSDEAVIHGLAPIPTEVRMDVTTKVKHPLTMKFQAYEGEKLLQEDLYLSLGGGEVYSDTDPAINENDVYPFRNFAEIKEYMKKEGISSLQEFCLRYEAPDIDEYLSSCVEHMFAEVSHGLEATGKIPANSNPRLQWNRVAKALHERALSMNSNDDGRNTLLMTSYAYAVGEGNACGEEIVTAPTCGASGVLPAALYFEHVQRKVPLSKIRDSLYAAGIIGNLVKQNASIAGSIGGCQAEIGTATSMASAALCQLNGLSLYQTEYAAEIAMEHFLGLSCDPVDGYVMIPCIERNGIGVCRAYDAYLYARDVAPIRKNQVSFDDVVAAMKLTGDSLSKAYKETAEGGLAAILKEKA